MTLHVHDYDWVEISPRRDAVLHAPDLTEAEEQLLDGEAYLEGGKVLCGRPVRHMNIPGIFTRMSAKRCDRCCDRIDLPRGVGSPKNDPACRIEMGI